MANMIIIITIVIIIITLIAPFVNIKSASGTWCNYNFWPLKVCCMYGTVVAIQLLLLKFYDILDFTKRSCK
jgi:uncharacterized membrane protein